MVINGKKTKIAFVHQNPHPAHAAWAKSVGAKFIYFRGNRKLRERGNKHLLLNLLRTKFIFCKPDVIISEGGAPLSPSIVMHNFSTNAKIILIMADETGIYVRENKDIYSRDTRAFLSMVDGAISVSGLTTETFEGLVPQSVKIKTVRPSIGDIFIRQSRFASGVLRRRNTICIVSKGGKRGLMDKIPGWLDDCFRIMKKTIPDLEIKIAGTQESSLKFANIRHLGIVKYTDMPKLYRETGILFHFPFFDPFPVSVMEALSCGCPVIVGKGCGNYEYFKEKNWNELTCDEDDPVTVSQKALEILNGSITPDRFRLFSDVVAKELSPSASSAYFRKSLEDILKQ
ncbi:glycosyltransferase [candidate division WOR-3 bacterium]|nr:glycosyltransferase [candidate division WOR-3 bacterium]